MAPVFHTSCVTSHHISHISHTQTPYSLDVSYTFTTRYEWDSLHCELREAAGGNSEE